MANNRELSQFANTVGYDDGSVGIGTDKPLDPPHASNTKVLSVGIVTANYLYGDGSNLTNVSGGGASAINDLSDAKTDNSGALLALGTGAAAADDGTNDGVAIGKDALNDQTTGTINCAVGNEAFSLLTTGGQSAAFGVYAGRYATGGSNVFLGYSAGEGVSGSASANYCTAVGEKAMENFTSGNYNSAFGYRSLRNVTTGTHNISGGTQSSDAVTTGSYNASWGNLSLGALTTGSSNIAIGYRALTSLDTWSHSVAIGRDAGAERSHHNNSTLIGGEAGKWLRGNRNTALGYQAMRAGGGTACSDNVGLGFQTLYNVSGDGDYNVAVGSEAGSIITTGENNICLGYNAEPSSGTADNEATIGNNSITKLRIPGIGITFGDNTTLTDGHVLTYSSSTGEVTLAASGGGSIAGINTLGTSHFNNLNITGFTTFASGGRADFRDNLEFRGLESGASNSLDFFSSGGVVDHSIIYNGENFDIGGGDHVKIDATGIGTVFMTNAGVPVAAFAEQTVKFYNASTETETLRIDSSGDVGIGTDNPSYKIQVENSGTALGRFLRTSAGAALFQIMSQDGGNITLGLGDVSDPDIQYIKSDNSDNSLSFGTNAGERVRITSNGRLGLDDTSPDANLSVGGSTAFIDVGEAGGNRGKIGYSSNDLYFGTSSSSGEFIFKNNVTSNDNPASSGTERFRIDADGYRSFSTQPYALLRKDGTSQSMSSDAFVQYDETVTSEGGMTISTNKDRITVPKTGKYAVFASAAGSNTTVSVGDGWRCEIWLNGSVYSNIYTFPINSTGASTGEEYNLQAHLILPASANDYFEIRVGSIGAARATVRYGYFCVYYLG